jgi:hypothetical protein
MVVQALVSFVCACGLWLACPYMLHCTICQFWEPGEGLCCVLARARQQYH